ncbi:MAG: guanylate kinase, partial [Candidatus Neomarinimicrobiota bacterium]|nr:guanylate kinase [Candidatus Neomarinimicrobiota bacterium]
MKNLICVSAPSGSGKTTLCKAIREARPDLIWSVSYTTRFPRDNETNGEDYNFISKEEFNSFLNNEEFAEWENVHGEYYGTIKYKLDDA